MANRIEIPKSNPIKIVEVGRQQAADFLTKHFYDYLLSEQVKDFPSLDQRNYTQKFSTQDVIRFQLHSEYSPLTMNLIDRKGKQVRSVIFTNIGVNIYEPTFFTFQAEISLSTVPPGCYFIQIIAGAIAPLKTFISEPISIKEKHPGTIRFDYRNSFYHDDIIYETGITFQFRVEGFVVYRRSDLKRYSYETQSYSERLLNGTDNEVYRLHIGNSFGIPGWVEAKLAKIMNHNEVMADGHYYTGTSDFKIDQVTEDGTWM